jgi:hypothetical protein
VGQLSRAEANGTVTRRHSPVGGSGFKCNSFAKLKQGVERGRRCDTSGGGGAAQSCGGERHSDTLSFTNRRLRCVGVAAHLKLEEGDDQSWSKRAHMARLVGPLLV